jgi:hypothetical protein
MERMSDEWLTDQLAVQVMGWRKAPGRYIKSGRSWIPCWRFSPLTDLNDAFLILERTDAQYSLTGDSDTNFAASVRIGRRNGNAAGQSKARVITVAVAGALQLEVDE